MKTIRDLPTKIVLLTITLVLLYTWALTGLGKVMGGNVPAGFQERFQDSLIATFPGTSIAFWSIALGETLVALLALVSLIRLEFWNGKTTWLRWTIVGSLVLFAQLGFGLRLIGDNSGAANLFFYFGATLIMYRMLDGSKAR